MARVALGNLATVLHSSTAGEAVEAGKRVLSSPVVTPLRPPMTLEESLGGEHNQFVDLQPGDLVFDQATGRWHLIPESYAEVVADESLVVVRPTPGSGVGPEYLLANLIAVPPVFRRRAPGLTDLEIIRGHEVAQPSLPPAETNRLLSDMLSGLDQLDELRDGIRRQGAIAFDLNLRDASAENLRGASDTARLVAEAAKRQRDPLQQVSLLYPYSIARPVRRYQAALEPAERYKLLLRAAECLVITLAQIGLARCRAIGAHTGALAIWNEAFRTRGVPFGTWLEVVQAAAKDLQDEKGFLARYRDGLLNRGSLLRSSLDAILKARNEDAHLRGPQNEVELDDALLELHAQLVVALQRASFLLAATWVLPDRSMLQKSGGGFRIIGWRAMGDHPDFERLELTWPTALAEDNLYAVDATAGIAIDLDPFAVMKDCPRCRAKEMYYPDRLRSDGARLVSFDRSHQMSSVDVGRDLVGVQDRQDHTPTHSERQSTDQAGRTPLGRA